jgi:hypothetical protein
MKNYVINNGTFTASGNFSGYTALGERVHIFGRQIQALGWAKQEDVKFPFYAIGTTKPIGQLDASGKPIVDANGVAITSDRLTALSAFKTREEIKQAHADAALLDVEIQQEIRNQASTAGLSEQALNALANASF